MNNSAYPNSVRADIGASFTVERFPSEKQQIWGFMYPSSRGFCVLDDVSTKVRPGHRLLCFVLLFIAVIY